jgi:hypothetical protein
VPRRRPQAERPGSRELHRNSPPEHAGISIERDDQPISLLNLLRGEPSTSRRAVMPETAPCMGRTGGRDVCGGFRCKPEQRAVAVKRNSLRCHGGREQRLLRAHQQARSRCAVYMAGDVECIAADPPHRNHIGGAIGIEVVQNGLPRRSLRAATCVPPVRRVRLPDRVSRCTRPELPYRYRRLKGPRPDLRGASVLPDRLGLGAWDERPHLRSAIDGLQPTTQITTRNRAVDLWVNREDDLLCS